MPLLTGAALLVSGKEDSYCNAFKFCFQALRYQALVARYLESYGSRAGIIMVVDLREEFTPLTTRLEEPFRAYLYIAGGIDATMPAEKITSI